MAKERNNLQEHFIALNTMRDNVNKYLKDNGDNYRVFWTPATNHKADSLDLDFVLFWIFELRDERRFPVAEGIWFHTYRHTTYDEVIKAVDEYLNIKK